jgi:hypothetical protein
VEGAIFVLNPSIDGWLDAISQPLPQQDVMDSGRPSRAKKPRAPSAPRQDPLAGFKLQAHYKGYGPWRVSWTCLIDKCRQALWCDLCIRLSSHSISLSGYDDHEW